jgi:5'(3')-deoxyribonucleotidase
MSRKKPENSRVCADCPTEWIAEVQKYNDTHLNQIVLSKHLKKTVKNSYNKLKEDPDSTFN